MCAYCTSIRGEEDGVLNVRTQTFRSLAKYCCGEFIEIACKLDDKWCWRRATLLVRFAVLVRVSFLVADVARVMQGASRGDIEVDEADQVAGSKSLHVSLQDIKGVTCTRPERASPAAEVAKEKVARANQRARARRSLKDSVLGTTYSVDRILARQKYYDKDWYVHFTRP
jgi:hypothetical protein